MTTCVVVPDVDLASFTWLDNCQCSNKGRYQFSLQLTLPGPDTSPSHVLVCAERFLYIHYLLPCGHSGVTLMRVLLGLYFYSLLLARLRLRPPPSSSLVVVSFLTARLLGDACSTRATMFVVVFSVVLVVAAFLVVLLLLLLVVCLLVCFCCFIASRFDLVLFSLLSHQCQVPWARFSRAIP